MKNKILPLFLTAATMLLSGCKNTNKDTNSDGKEPAETKSYTVMIYLCGSDLESYSSDYGSYGSQATNNLKEILAIKDSIPDDLNIIVETGGVARNNGHSGWDNENIQESQPGLTLDDSVLQRWKIDKSGMHQVGENITYSHMSKESTFQSFMEWGLTDFPAEKTGVILWNHGGAMEGCCFDEKAMSDFSSDALTPIELKTAMGKAFEKVNRSEKLEWIGYDACLMSVADIAYYNSEYFNYMVSSEETEPGGGWDYDNWLDNLCANVNISTVELLLEVCTTYSSKTEADYATYAAECLAYGNDSSNFTHWDSEQHAYTDDAGYTAQSYLDDATKYADFNDATLAVLDLSKMEAYKSAFNAMAGSLNSYLSQNDKYDDFAENVLEKSQRFGATEGYYSENVSYPYDTFDAASVVSKIESKYSSINTSAYKSALADVVVHNTTGKSYSTAPCGLCMYFSYESETAVTSAQAAFINAYSLMQNLSSDNGGGLDWDDWF